MAQDILADNWDQVTVISFTPGLYVSLSVYQSMYNTHANTSGFFLNTSQAHLIFRFVVTQSNKLTKKQFAL